MKAPSLALALTLAAALPAPAPGANGVRYSVQAAVERALEHNPDLDAARARIAQARQDLAASRAAYRPAVGVQVDALRGDAPSSYLFRTIDARRFSPGTNFNDPPALDSVGAALDLQYTVWDAGRRRHARDAAQAGRRASRQDRDRVANDLIEAVVHAYFDVLAAEESVAVAEASLRTVRAERADAQVRYEGGASLRTDVLSLEVRVARAEEERLQAAGAARLARAALARLLDHGVTDALELTGEEWEPATLPEEVGDGLALASRIRPELQALEHRLDAARAGVEQARAAWRPRLDVTGRYWLNDPGGDLELGRDNWLVGAAVRWDLADGGRRRAGEQKAARARDELAARRRSLERAVELQVQQAYVAWEVARERHRVAAANVARAAETLRLVGEQFDGGAATVTRFLQAEEDNTRAHLGEIRARYGRKKAKATVGHALGLCVANLRGEGSQP